MTVRDALRSGVDRALEFSVVGSFTRIGPAVRQHLFAWQPLSEQRMDGKVAIVTGATSGLGLVTATELARMGCQVVLVVRDLQRGERACAEITSSTGNGNVSVIVADLGDLDAVRCAAQSLHELGPIDVLIHNAGALSKTRRLSPQGIEQTVAAQLIGPFLLTNLLAALLTVRPSRVIWVTSGGMYAEPLQVDSLEMDAAGYNGVTAYARAKRAQVSLVEMWAPRLRLVGITMTAMHPGWADTPGIHESLPTFGRVLGRLLRSPLQGADTIVWLASAPVCTGSSGADIVPAAVWLDRRPRSAHRLARTRRSDTPEERRRLWDFCRERSGITEQELAVLS